MCVCVCLCVFVVCNMFSSGNVCQNLIAKCFTCLHEKIIENDRFPA